MKNNSQVTACFTGKIQSRSMGSKQIIRRSALVFCVWAGCSFSVLSVEPQNFTNRQLPIDQIAIINTKVEELALSGHLFTLEDREGHWNIQQIKDKFNAGEFEAPQKKVPSYGWTNSIYWGYLKIKNLTPEKNFILTFGSALFEKIEIWLMIDGFENYRKTGSLVSALEKEANGLNPVFDLQLPQEKTAEIFFRFKKENSMFLSLNLRNEDFHRKVSQADTAILFLYFGLMLGMICYNCFLYFSLRENVYLYYILFIFSFLILRMVETGAAAVYIWPNWQFSANQLELIFINLAGFFGIKFSQKLLNFQLILPGIFRGFTIFSSFGLVLAIFLIFFGHLLLPYAQLYLFSLLFQIALIIGILAVATYLFLKKESYESAKYYLLAWGFFLGAILTYIFMASGLLPVNIFTLNVMQVGSALEVLFLSFSLANKINIARIEKEQALEQLLNIQALQKTNLEVQVKEKTTDLEKALLEMKKLAITDSLTQLPNRRYFFEQFYQMAKLAKQNQLDLVLFLLDIDDFKKINDQYGHAIGDKALIVMADFLTRYVAGHGLVGRLGGEEFGILMQVDSQFDITQFLDKLFQSKSGLAFQIEDQSEIKITFSMGVMRLYHYELENFYQEKLDSVMSMADQAMYMAKKGGKNQYMILRS